MAERKGFEPSIPYGIHAFQASAFNHSATSLILFKNKYLGHVVALLDVLKVGKVILDCRVGQYIRKWVVLYSAINLSVVYP